MLRRFRRPVSPRSHQRGGRPRQRRPNRLRGVETLEQRQVLSGLPFGALPHDTAEYMLGDVHVTVVLMESNNQISSVNNNSENWTPSSIAAVKEKVTDGLQWWVDTLAGITDKHYLNFHIDFTYADNPVSTSYEPITRPSTDFQFWINDFLNLEVQTTGFFANDVRNFNHQQRQENNTDWAFTIFVVNDENDANKQFAPGGLDRAFAFPGGLFLVTLASRPASTIAHEAGHIFWGLDEYEFGGTYSTTRGYYNTPNTNAWNNPTPGFVREPSIMDRGACEEGGGLLCVAWQQNISAASTLAQVGWRDSNGNGVFDVLDVPHTLTGTGVFDPDTGTYQFVGHSSVQTLPNLNPRKSGLATESLQSDITINKISRVEYRIDGGSWQTATSPNTYTVDLDLSIPIPEGAEQLELRTIDTTTGVTSPIFVGSLTRPSTATTPGISGFAFADANRDGVLTLGEAGLAGQTIQLVDSSGQPILLERRLEPDDFAANAVIGQALAGVTVRAVGDATANELVYSRAAVQTSTGSRVFSACSFAQSGGGTCSIFASEWTSRTRKLRIDFDSPTTTVSIDAVSNSAIDYGRLEIYDASNNLLGRYTTQALGVGQSETMTLSRPTADIAYAIAGGHADTAVLLDNLRIGPKSNAVTNELGAYSIPYLPAGNYRVQVVPPIGSMVTGAAIQSVTLASGEAVSQIDFGLATFVSPWQNPQNPNDVNGDGQVSPIDVLLVINAINAQGSRMLSSGDIAPPYLDANGDGFVSPIDALRVINAIESSNAEGELSGSMALIPTGAGATSEIAGGRLYEIHESAAIEDAETSQRLAVDLLMTDQTDWSGRPASGNLVGEVEGEGTDEAREELPWWHWTRSLVAEDRLRLSERDATSGPDNFWGVTDAESDLDLMECSCCVCRILGA